MWPAIPPEWGRYSYFKPSLMEEVEFHGVYSRKPLYITPYVLGGSGQSYRLGSGGTAYHRSDDLSHEIGLDVKYGITSNLTLDATVNTDFAQVEADDQQVNLTRFSLFFPMSFPPFTHERGTIISGLKHLYPPQEILSRVHVHWLRY